MIRRHAVAFAVAAGLLALMPGPAAAEGSSCVGQFASTNAQLDGAAFGADIKLWGAVREQAELRRRRRRSVRASAS